MTTTAIRKRLISYLENAGDKEIKALYTLVEEKINREETYSLTDEQLSIVNERRADYLVGKDSGSSWQTAHKNIRNRRKKDK